MKELEEKELLSKISKVLWVFYRCVHQQDATEIRDLLDKFTGDECTKMFFYIQDKIVEECKNVM